MEIAIHIIFLQVQAKGVDSVGSGFADPVSFIREIAKRERKYAVDIASTSALKALAVKVASLS